MRDLVSLVEQAGGDEARKVFALSGPDAYRTRWTYRYTGPPREQAGNGNGTIFDLNAPGG